VKSCRILVALVATILAIATTARCKSPKPVDEARLAGIVAKAPPQPAGMELGLKTHLVDFIDCADPNNPHDFLDQGTSKVVAGPAGRYRVTAAHRHAFFSYAYRSAGKDKPVLLVIEYPDDADRVISFMTHDSMRATLPHTSFSEETGVYTGGVMPLTGKMQCFTLVAWPQDDWSPLIVLNFGRVGGGGAAARIWVYAIDDMPPLLPPADADHPRGLGAFFPLAFLAERDNFGWKSPHSIEHMVDYLRWVGANRVTMEVYANQSWGAMCTVPSWDVDDKGYLDNILRQMDAKGGVDFIAGIVAPGMYGKVIAGGKEIGALPAPQAKAALLKGFDELLDRYGKYKSFKGIALGSMETIGFLDLLKSKGCLAEVVGHIQSRRPDLEVLTFLGNSYLQTPYFDGKAGPSSWEVVTGWEQAGGDWGAYLAGQVGKCWQNWGHAPEDLKKIAGLHVYEMYYPNDHRLHDLYRQEPRQRIYWDVDHSQARSDLAATPYAGIFDTFTEGHIGLHADLNFWYTKPWTAPAFNPAGPFAGATLALALGQRDRQAILAGGWSVLLFGTEQAWRRAALALRSLPPVELADVAGEPDTVKVRWVLYKGKRYVSAVNLTPFPAEVAIDGKEVALAPYDITAFSDSAAAAPKVEGAPSPRYRAMLQARIADYEKLCADVRALDPQAAPEVYLKPAAEARRLLEAGSAYAADVALGVGLAGELQLRKDILDRPTLQAPKVSAAPPMKGDLDAWPKEAFDLRADTADYIAGHIFFPNSWTGPDDLSVRLRLAHDGENLYLGVEVRDSVIEPTDNVTVSTSKSGYCQWRGASVKPDETWIAAPPAGAEPASRKGGSFQYTIRRTAAGYLLEGSAPLAALGAKPGGSLGLLLRVADGDKTPNLAKQTWARKLEFLVPNKPNFAYWDDARNCGRVALE
jgi:hypothetical protein